MRQIGFVSGTDMERGTAQVRVSRMSACEGCHKSDPGMTTEGVRYSSCHECSVFPQETELTVSARNPVGAGKGNRVLLETESTRILGYAAAVFLLPLLGAFLFYAAASSLSLPLWGTVTAVLCGFALPLCFCKFVLEPRAGKRTEYTIVKILSDRNAVTGTEN